MAQRVLALGISMQIDGRKARRVRGWEPRSAETSVIDTGESLIAAGV